MKGERKLILVPPADPRRESPRDEAGLRDPELAAPSDAEAREARALAEAIDRGKEPLALALRAAARPSGLDEADHDALLARALGDEGAPPTRVEQREAEALRDALDQRGEAAELALSLRAAWSPKPLLELRNEALLARALRGRGGERPRRIAPITMAALSAVAAIAAGVALMYGQAADRLEQAVAPQASPAQPAEIRAALIPARSTTDLFDAAAPFPREGGETERIDRIASARAADLRANRYAAWGVR
jgi:hypothetical protein